MHHRKPLEVRVTDTASGVRVYTLDGDLFGSTGGYAFQDQVRDAVAAGTRRIALDLSHVERVDSAGIGILITVVFSASRAGGGLVVACLSKHVENALGIAMLLDHVDRAATLDEALRKLEAMDLGPAGR